MRDVSRSLWSRLSCDTLTCTFDGTTSTDPENGALSYDWDFVDGSAHATTATATHTYASAGDQAVTLKVTDGNGTEDLVVAQYPDISTKYEVYSWDRASREWMMLLLAVRPMGGLPDSTWVNIHGDTICFRTTTCTILPNRMEVDHRDTTRCEHRVKWLAR